jgi:uncharacterized membrane protein
MRVLSREFKMIRELLFATLAVALILFPLDMVWLKLARPFYESQMGAILLPEPRIAIAAVFYLVYTVGIAFFAVLPNLQSATIWNAIFYGAFLGLIAYGTYDVSNYATLKDFTLHVMIVDWTWGTILTATSSAGAWALYRWFS